MMLAALRAFLALAILCGSARAQDLRPIRTARSNEQPDKIEQTIGNWYVSIEKDPFADKKKTIAVTPAIGERGVLAIRCFPDEGLTALIFPKTEKEYDKARLSTLSIGRTSKQLFKTVVTHLGQKEPFFPMLGRC